MPVWPSPDAQLTEKAIELHQSAFDASEPFVASAPATWNFLGEHTDYVGGVVVNATAPLRVAVAATPRTDDTLTVTMHELDPHGDLVNFTGSVTLSEITQHASYMQHPQEGDSAGLPLGGLEVRLGGVVWSMVNRQYLSRDTRGYNITVLSEVPNGVGLGDEVATEVAFATILAEASGHKLDPPLRARLAELCASSARLFSAAPSFRSRYTAALRGSADAFNIVDYADGSVTHAPMLNDVHTSFLVALPDRDARLADIAARERFLSAAGDAFGVDCLRRLPDATPRAIQWLTAVHKADEAAGLPGIEEAHRWLTFYDQEIVRTQRTAMALRARKAHDAVAHLNQSQNELSSLYRVVPEREQALAELCVARGAVATRSASAGLAHAVIVHAPVKQATNLIADLADDGFTVVLLDNS